MLVTTVDKKIKFYQRVILMIMLVFMPFYSVGSDFFLEGFPSSSIEVVENGVHDVLDFDDNASLRTVRQEQIQIQQFVADFIADWLTIINVHELIHSLELQQCAFLPIFYQLHKTQSFVWFCSYLIYFIFQSVYGYVVPVCGRLCRIPDIARFIMFIIIT